MLGLQCLPGQEVKNIILFDLSPLRVITVLHLAPCWFAINLTCICVLKLTQILISFLLFLCHTNIGIPVKKRSTLNKLGVLSVFKKI